MKHHFVKTENSPRLLAGVAYMENRGSRTTPMMLVYGDPATGKTENVSHIGPDLPAIFIKGYSLVCRDMPELRRSFLSFPYPRLWQHADSTACACVALSPWQPK